MDSKVSEGSGRKAEVRHLHESDVDGNSMPLRSPSQRVSNSPIKRLSRLWPYWIGLGLAAILFFLGIRYQGAVLAPSAMMQKLETLAALRLDLLKSVESEKRAVMADTDEASRVYAEESKQATEAVGSERDKLAKLIELYPTENENRLLHEFDETWEQLRKLDQQILELAVQNTNLKAARISFGKASEALNRFQAALEELAAGTDNIGIVRPAFEALTALLVIQALHAPHIASSDDGEMTRIEQTIREKEIVIRNCLDQLARIIPTSKQNTLLQATEAFSEYADLTRTVVDLSRQNTNVTSFAISLDRKLKMTAQCEVILGKLQEAIKEREFKATR